MTITRQEFQKLWEPLSNGKKGYTAQIQRLVGDGYFKPSFVQKLRLEGGKDSEVLKQLMDFMKGYKDLREEYVADSRDRVEKVLDMVRNKYD